MIFKIAQRARLQLIRDERVPVVNCTAFEDEVCAEMLKRFPDAAFAACWYERINGSQVWRLRYRDTDDVTEFIEPAIDVEAIIAERDELQSELIKFL